MSRSSLTSAVYSPSGEEGVTCGSRRPSQEPRPVSPVWPRAPWHDRRSVAGPSCPPLPPARAGPTQTCVPQLWETKHAGHLLRTERFLSNSVNTGTYRDTHTILGLAAQS